MSVTQTLPSPSKLRRSNTSTSILLTPQKRRREANANVNHIVQPVPSPSTSSTNVPARSSLREREESKIPDATLLSWVFSKASVAPCFAKDVLEMEQGNPEQDYFWLGRVPCRTVKLVGMIVGADEFDNMTRYKLDDGTAVIDCDVKHPIATKPASPKAKSKYRPPEKPKPRYSKPPLLSVGTCISVRGRIIVGRGTRFLRADATGLAVCSSVNDEPLHWLAVLKLHVEHYSSEEPFQIPSSSNAQKDASPIDSSEPPLDSISLTNSSETLLSSPGTSCSSSTAGSSPARPTSSSDPPRLRHPSRLHSRDLTDITFRIYLKHFMDFAPPYEPLNSCASSERCTTPTPTRRSPTLSFDTPTPTRRSPTPSSDIVETPKPIKPGLSFGNDDIEDEAGDQLGFTLSYLRRVPVLAHMARRVVRAERKRREKEQHRHENQKSAPAKKERPPESTARKMKRLYQKAIRDLYTEGSIVLWDGPCRPCSHAAAEEVEDASMLWKSRTSTAVSTCSSQTTVVVDSADELSDPEDQEEAYLPITVQTVSSVVLKTLRSITTREFASGNRRRRAPPKSEDILRFIRASDARWANLGGWIVDEALEKLASDERVFKAGDNRWALCA